jgi:glycosyltransferase involved in cell wall biosynthesis
LELLQNFGERKKRLPEYSMATILSIVSYPFLPARVGGQKGIALFNKYFCRYHRLICVTTKKNDPRAAEGYEVLNILSDSPVRYLNIFYFFTLRNLIREKKATHVLLEHPYYGWLAVLLKWSCRVKLIIHSHNLEGLRWKTLGKSWWRMLWLYEKWTHRQANYNFFIHDQNKQYAIEHFGLKPVKCMTLSYGIEWDKLPGPEELNAASMELRKKYRIAKEETILFFNGAFDYSPNKKALLKILEVIHPLLLQQIGFSYRILICGRDIPLALTALKQEKVIFAGYVEDIALYFKGSDVFLNPITEGGGIKTKLVEALAYNLNAVSTLSGAMGVPAELCNGKLLLCDDEDWAGFCALIQQAAGIRASTPNSYFNHFFWGYTAKRAADFIDS